MIEQLRAAAADPAVEASLPAEAPAPAAVAAAAGGDAAEDAAPAAPPTRWEALCQAHLTAFAALAVLKAASSESAEVR